MQQRAGCVREHAAGGASLLKLMYKVCMATMSSRILRSLHEYGLLDAAQLGFVMDGSCHVLIRMQCCIAIS